MLVSEEKRDYDELDSPFGLTIHDLTRPCRGPPLLRNQDFKGKYASNREQADKKSRLAPYHYELPRSNYRYFVIEIPLAPCYFALVCLYTDGYLRIQDGVPEGGKVARFMGIVSRLPFDLQLVLCNISAGSPKQFMTGEAIGVALNTLITHFGRE